MATSVPYTGELSVTPEDRPIPSRSAEAPLSAFGGASAAATSQLGGQLEKSGTELWDRAIAMQELKQKADAQNAVSKLADGSSDLEVDFRSKEGKAAIDALPTLRKGINDLREKIGSELGSDYARNLYLQESRAIQTRLVTNAGIHAGDQLKHHLIGSAQARADSSINSVSASPESEDVYKAAIDNIHKTADDIGDIKSWDPAVKDDYIHKQTADAVTARVSSLYRTKPDAAEKFLNDAINRGDINGKEAGDLYTKVRNQKLNVATRVESSKLMSGENGAFGAGPVSLDQADYAIKMIESSGGKNTNHPLVTQGKYAGQHALGDYGVMPGNLQGWLKEAGMDPMSPREFEADKSAQQQLFRSKFGQLMKENGGDANKAAMVWFTGEPEPNPNRSDGGSTAAKYKQDFNMYIARGSSASQVREVAERHADTIAPGDEQFKIELGHRTVAEHRLNMQVEREDEYNRRQVVEDALVPGKDGKLPTSFDGHPEAEDAYNQMDPVHRDHYAKVLQQNAKGGYGATPENQQMFKKYIGMLTNANPTPEESQEAMELKVGTLPLPATQIEQIRKLQKSLIEKTQKNPPIDRALHAIDQELNAAQLTKKLNNDDYLAFKGTLSLALEQRLQENPGKPFSQEEFREMGLGLLRDYVYSKSDWGSFFNSSAKVYKVPVPEPQRKKIIDDYVRENNREPDDIEIQRIHSVALSKLLNKKAAEKK